MMVFFLILLGIYIVLFIWTIIVNGWKEGLEAIGAILLIIGIGWVVLMAAFFVQIYIGELIMISLLIFFALLSIMVDKKAETKPLKKFSKHISELMTFGVMALLVLSFEFGLKYYVSVTSSYNYTIPDFIFSIIHPLTGKIPLFIILGINLVCIILSFTKIWKNRKIIDKTRKEESNVKNILLYNKACAIVEHRKTPEKKEFSVDKFSSYCFKVPYDLKDGFGAWYKAFSIVAIATFAVMIATKAAPDLLIITSMLYFINIIICTLVAFWKIRGFNAFSKKLENNKEKIMNYAKQNPEVENYVLGFWSEEKPLNTIIGINLYRIMERNSCYAVRLEISPGLSALTYYAAGNLLGNKYEEYKKAQKHPDVSIDYLAVSENRTLKDQEIKISFMVKYDYGASTSEISRVYNVSDEKTNEEKSTKIIQLLDDYINEMIKSNKNIDIKKILSDSGERLKEILPEYQKTTIFSSYQLKPFEMLIIYEGRELFRHNFVECEDGQLAEKMDEIFKTTSRLDFENEVFLKFVEYREETLKKNKEIFKNL